MRLDVCSQLYADFTAKASDVARQLAFAGIAIVWIFRQQAGDKPVLPTELLLPAALFAVTLAFDLLQYIAASISWGLLTWKWRCNWYRDRDKLGIEGDRDYLIPKGIKTPQLFFFVAKLTTVLTAYALTAKYLLCIWYRS